MASLEKSERPRTSLPSTISQTTNNDREFMIAMVMLLQRSATDFACACRERRLSEHSLSINIATLHFLLDTGRRRYSIQTYQGTH
eukprot:scaffold2240_cov172-Ochromonas_danica.AAC.13